MYKIGMLPPTFTTMLLWTVVIMTFLNAQATINMKVVPLKVFDKNGRGTLFNFVCALYHAIDHDADIINISAGYSGQASGILEEAIALAHSKGQFIVTATGNEGLNIDSFAGSLR